MFKLLTNEFKMLGVQLHVILKKLMRSQVMIQNVESYKLLTYGLSHVQTTDQ